MTFPSSSATIARKNGDQTFTGTQTFTSTIVGSITGNAATVTNGIYSTSKISDLSATSSSELAGKITDETGTGALVFATSPTLVTPNLGTPSAAVLTNATGLPITTGVSGLATGVATVLATPSSSNLISAITDETGTGSLVFATSPTLVTPNLGTPSAAVLTNATGLPLTTGVTGILPIANGGTGSSTQNFVDLTTTQTVAGAKTFSGNTSVGGTLGVTGATTLSSTLAVSGNTTVGGTTTLNGNTSVSGTNTLTVGTGATSLGGTLAVTGATTLSSTLAVSGNTTVGGTTTLNGNTSVSGTNTLTVGTGATSLGGTLTVTGATTLNGSLTIPSGAGVGEVLVSDANGVASWSYSPGSVVVRSTNAGYNIGIGDSYIFYTGTGNVTFTLPTGVTGKEITIKNKTANTITISGTSGIIYVDKDNTAVSSVTVGNEASNNWIRLVFDGTQWNVLRALF